MNARIGRLNNHERYLGGRFGVDSSRADNGERFLQLCADHRLFVANTNFQHKRSHRVTWRPLNSRQDWSQLDHIAISYRWRTSVADCSFHPSCVLAFCLISSEFMCVLLSLGLICPCEMVVTNPCNLWHDLELINWTSQYGYPRSKLLECVPCESKWTGSDNRYHNGHVIGCAAQLECSTLLPIST